MRQTSSWDLLVSKARLVGRLAGGQSQGATSAEARPSRSIDMPGGETTATTTLADRM